MSRRAAAQSPIGDPTGALGGRNQHGPVWFLDGTFGGSVERTVTIPAGAASIEMDVAAMDDTLVEGDETVIVTIAPDPAYRPGVPSSAVVIVASDDLPPDLKEPIKRRIFDALRDEAGVAAKMELPLYQIRPSSPLIDDVMRFEPETSKRLKHQGIEDCFKMLVAKDSITQGDYARWVEEIT